MKVLEVGETHILHLDESSKETIAVTVFDANHCPGSVMFLFQGYFGAVFYTGDFRYDSPLEQSFTLPPSLIVDKLYLDNTYCSPECDHPTREAAADTIIKIIFQNANSRIHIAVRRVGKEDLLVKIAQTLKEWIVVTPEMYDKLKLLELPNVFTCDVDASRIHAVPFELCRAQHKKKWSQPLLTILPTSILGVMNRQPYIEDQNIFIVPYSDHSSYSELIEFVSKIRPRCVIPIVTGAINRQDMTVFQYFLNPTPSKHVTMPLSLQYHRNYTNKRKRTTSRRNSRKARVRRKPSISRLKGTTFIDDDDDNTVEYQLGGIVSTSATDETETVCDDVKRYDTTDSEGSCEVICDKTLKDAIRNIYNSDNDFLGMKSSVKSDALAEKKNTKQTTCKAKNGVGSKMKSHGTNGDVVTSQSPPINNDVDMSPYFDETKVFEQALETNTFSASNERTDVEQTLDCDYFSAFDEMKAFDQGLCDTPYVFDDDTEIFQSSLSTSCTHLGSEVALTGSLISKDDYLIDPLPNSAPPVQQTVSSGDGNLHLDDIFVQNSREEYLNSKRFEENKDSPTAELLNDPETNDSTETIPYVPQNLKMADQDLLFNLSEAICHSSPNTTELSPTQLQATNTVIEESEKRPSQTSSSHSTLSVFPSSSLSSKNSVELSCKCYSRWKLESTFRKVLLSMNCHLYTEELQWPLKHECPFSKV